MKDFWYYVPTRVNFGPSCFQYLVDTIHQWGTKPLIVYGGGSIKRNGAYDAVVSRLKEAGIPYAEMGGVAPNPRYESVLEGNRICREEILTEEPPQAVFAVSDELAMGVIKAAREENIPLPEGLAVAGFTGSEAAAVITPALTTMEHPLERLGAVAARRLIELIEDSALYQVETHEIVLKSKLKIRRSCGNRKEIYELFE